MDLLEPLIQVQAVHGERDADRDDVAGERVFRLTCARTRGGSVLVRTRSHALTREGRIAPNGAAGAA